MCKLINCSSVFKSESSHYFLNTAKMLHPVSTSTFFLLTNTESSYTLNLITAHICTPDQIPLRGPDYTNLLHTLPIPHVLSCRDTDTVHTHTHAHRSINNIACRQFLLSNSHAMTSQGLTYSRRYRAARIKSDWQPLTLNSIPYTLPYWRKQLTHHNIFEWSLMSVQSWRGED